ncbi:MAG: hypothetical protein WA959_16595 [Rivularia sp. (in: cyanobacteria)]
MKFTHQLMFTASFVIFTTISATKAMASNFTFIQEGWSNVDANTTLSGSFSVTPQANGELDLNNLTAFNAEFGTSSNTRRTWNLEDLSRFTYNTLNDSLTFSADNSETTVSEDDFFTVTETLDYNIGVNSNPQEPSRYSLGLFISISPGFGNNIGTIFSSETFELPQVTQISSHVEQIPESSTISTSLAAAIMSAWLIKKKKINT